MNDVLYVIDVLIETCGDFPWKPFQEKLLPNIDQVFVDLKLCDEGLHKKFTSRNNRRIKRNIRKLAKIPSIEMLVRIPLVPEVTATKDNLIAIARWMRSASLARMALLPYNPLWLEKAQGLGKDLEYRHATWMSQQEREAVKKVFKGFEIVRDI